MYMSRYVVYQTNEPWLYSKYHANGTDNLFNPCVCVLFEWSNHFISLIVIPPHAMPSFVSCVFLNNSRFDDSMIIICLAQTNRMIWNSCVACICTMDNKKNKGSEMKSSGGGSKWTKTIAILAHQFNFKIHANALFGRVVLLAFNPTQHPSFHFRRLPFSIFFPGWNWISGSAWQWRC